VVAWGDNEFGKSTIPPGLENVIAVGAGSEHSVALRSDGTVVAWGDNRYGQTNVPPGLTNVIAIAAGLWHNLALRNDGTIVGWGDGDSGELTAAAGMTNVVAISAGEYLSLAISAPSKISSLAVEAGNLAMRFQTFTGRQYRLERSDTLIGPQWTEIGNSISGSGNEASVSDGITPGQNRFYRLVER
jgi:hypothetical protein